MNWYVRTLLDCTKDGGDCQRAAYGQHIPSYAALLYATAFEFKSTCQIWDWSCDRDPQFSGAERTCLWELVSLSNHVHPSVSAMTKALLAGVPIEYAGDPIRDLSTASFLDKFIQKKPKVKDVPSCLRLGKLKLNKPRSSK